MATMTSPTVSAAPVTSAVTCRTDVTTLTVGEAKDLICDASGLASQSKVAFSNGDLKAPYEIQFLGEPQVSSGKIMQRFTSYKVGSHSLTQLKLTIDAKDFPISPQTFEVKSVIEQGQTPTPIPSFGPDGVPVPWWWAIWGVALGAIVILIVWRLIKFQKSRVKKITLAAIKPQTPYEKFHTRMRKLESSGLHLRGEYKAFALELTSIVKTAMGENLHFAAEDMTSEEIVSTLERRHKIFFNTAGQSLALFLADLDQIKFAKVETTSEKCKDLLDRGSRIGNAVFGAIT